MPSPNKQFSKKAALLWAMIPKGAQAEILANVFCVKCSGSAQITKCGGELVEGDLHLMGSCSKCGHEVVRVVETSEIEHGRN